MNQPSAKVRKSLFFLVGFLLPLGALAKATKLLRSRGIEEDLRWEPQTEGKKWLVETTPSHLETNFAAWPRRHEGWLVIRRLDKTVTSLRNQLAKHGVESHVVGDRFLRLAPPQAASFFGWLGREPRTTNDYYVLDCDGPDEAEAFALNHLAQDLPMGDLNPAGDAIYSPTIRFRCVNSTVGPFDREEAALALADALQAGVERFANLEPEDTLLTADLPPVLQSVRPDDKLRILIRRRKAYEILVRRNDETEAQCFRLEADRWRPADAVGLPASMKKPAGPIRWLVYPLMAPIFIVFTLTLFLIGVRTRYRLRRAKLQREPAEHR